MSVDYKPFKKENHTLKNDQNGHLVPDGNPFKIGNNSEMLLLENRKPIDTSLDEMIKIQNRGDKKQNSSAFGMISPSNL